jgi:hypothetical protein
LRSPRGVVAAAVFLLALPVAALCQLFAGKGAGPAMHFMLALGSALLVLALRDFQPPKMATWLGQLSLGALAAIFFLQGVAEVVNNATLSQFAFRILGQRLETVLVAGFFIWCIALVLGDATGKTRVFGFVAIALAISARVIDYILATGTTPDAALGSLKLLYLVPFVWLLLESKKHLVIVT